MKYFLVSAICLLFLLIQHPGYSQTNTFYTVQIGTFLDSKVEDFEGVRPLGMVYARKLDDNLYQVFLGGFDQREAADQVVGQLRQRGYNSATVVEIPISEGRNITVIQFEMFPASQKPDWSRYKDIGNIFAIIGQDQIKLVTGPYTGVDEARQDLLRIQQAGFKDAFIKRINTGYLQKMNSFETGIKEPLIPLALEESTAAAPAAAAATGGQTTPRSVPESASATLPASTTAQPQATPAPPTPPVSNIELPDIRPTVKRRSALELQKVLKEQKTYTGSLDGLYGDATATAYEQTLRINRDLTKYQLLAKSLDISAAGPDDAVQRAINNLLTDANAVQALEQSDDPIAKAYRAYFQLTTMGPSIEVNNLMNTAIHQAFINKQLNNPVPFDFTADYAYNDVDQLLYHLHYLHGAPENRYAEPCWVLQRHPQEAARAFNAATGRMGESRILIQGCSPFLEWPEVRVLMAIALDLDGAEKVDVQQLYSRISERTRLSMAAQPLPNQYQQEVDSWYAQTIAGLDGWATIDPLHNRLVTAFKVAFFQTQVRLEDYYMDRGLTADQAKGLALATLKTMVEAHLERFI